MRQCVIMLINLVNAALGLLFRYVLSSQNVFVTIHYNKSMTHFHFFLLLDYFNINNTGDNKRKSNSFHEI